VTSGRRTLASAFARGDSSLNASRKEIIVQRFTIPRTLLSRRAALALGATAIVARPAGVRAHWGNWT
jgi:hypothetical protein